MYAVAQTTSAHLDDKLLKLVKRKSYQIQWPKLATKKALSALCSCSCIFKVTGNIKGNPVFVIADIFPRSYFEFMETFSLKVILSAVVIDSHFVLKIDEFNHIYGNIFISDLPFQILEATTCSWFRAQHGKLWIPRPTAWEICYTFI